MHAMEEWTDSHPLGSWGNKGLHKLLRHYITWYRMFTGLEAMLFLTGSISWATVSKLAGTPSKTASFILFGHFQSLMRCFTSFKWGPVFNFKGNSKVLCTIAEVSGALSFGMSHPGCNKKLWYAWCLQQVSWIGKWSKQSEKSQFHMTGPDAIAPPPPSPSASTGNSTSQQLSQGGSSPQVLKKTTKLLLE